MTDGNLIKAEIAPPESGGYYVILEAKRSTFDPCTGETLISAGDIEAKWDWYDKEGGYFRSIGKANPIWKVCAWADLIGWCQAEDDFCSYGERRGNE